MDRYIALFDTSALTAAAAISAAVLSLYGDDKGNALGCSPNIDIYTSAPASNTALVAGDFDCLGTVSQTGSPITYAAWSITGYNAFTFDATGRGNISKTGISKFGARNANYDVANTAPSWVTNVDAYVTALNADSAGTTNDPKLVVTYTISSPSASPSGSPSGSPSASPSASPSQSPSASPSASPSPGNAIATVTGTATATIIETDIVTGNKTIVITLNGDTWIPA
jgi:hypothetical protein